MAPETLPFKAILYTNKGSQSLHMKEKPTVKCFPDAGRLTTEKDSGSVWGMVRLKVTEVTNIDVLSIRHYSSQLTYLFI